MILSQRIAIELLPFIISNVKIKSNVIIGCSGGADSTALSIIMSKIIPEYPLNIKLTYINHNIRNKEIINKEKTYVSNLASFLNFDYSFSDIEENEFDTIHNGSVENTLRVLRYEKLAINAQKFNSNVILTGHTATDNAETILFNIVRGTGLKGIEGINKKLIRKINSNSLQILRPILDIQRITTENICSENNILPMTDISNKDLKFTRNRIRNKIIPELNKINPKTIDALNKLSSIAKNNNESNREYIDHFYYKLISEKDLSKTINDLIVFRILPDSIRTELIRRIMSNKSVKKQFNMEHIHKIDKLLFLEGNKQYDLPNGYKFTKEYNIARFERKINIKI
tara:strand:- start:47828 stop:48853 length:1026 start_codon:yes stop_codon:yes gene_type:complete